jgi:hypothetical protein
MVSMLFVIINILVATYSNGITDPKDPNYYDEKIP